MDKTWLHSKLDSIVPGTVLEIRKFGWTDLFSVWVEAQSVQKMAQAIKNDPDLQLDWLENLSVVEFEAALVVSYFVRSFSLPYQLVVRISGVPDDFKKVEKSGQRKQGSISVPSVKSVWPMAEPLENEAEEMFGVRFSREDRNERSPWKIQNLPPGCEGFPLRKNFQFPRRGYVEDLGGEGLVPAGDSAKNKPAFQNEDSTLEENRPIVGQTVV